MFKRKTWTEVKRHYTAPNSDVKNVKNISEDLLMKIAYGFTSIEMRCDQTGEVKYVTQYGDQR